MCMNQNYRRHNEGIGVSNHRRLDCLLKRLFRRRLKKTSKLCVTGICAGNSPVTGEFPTQRASNAGDVSIWWRHHESKLVKYGDIYQCNVHTCGNCRFPYWNNTSNIINYSVETNICQPSLCWLYFRKYGHIFVFCFLHTEKAQLIEILPRDKRRQRSVLQPYYLYNGNFYAGKVAS